VLLVALVALALVVRGDDAGNRVMAAWLDTHRREVGTPLTVLRLHRRPLDDHPNATGSATRARSMLASATLDVMGSVKETGCGTLRTARDRDDLRVTGGGSFTHTLCTPMLHIAPCPVSPRNMPSLTTPQQPCAVVRLGFDGQRRVLC
jgi:hypothetical protein